MRWLKPFNRQERKAVLKLLDTVVYVTEEETRQILVSLNNSLLQRLNGAGIRPSEVVYVQVHDPGSSSPVILNILKDYAQLERQGCHLVDSKDAVGFARLFGTIDGGAIVYVDDFAGTGNQFCSVRDVLAPLIPTTFAEFVIMPAMCEEAYGRLATRGIEPYTRFVHSKGDRPLLDASTILDLDTRSLLRSLCAQIVPPLGLGYEGIASNIVFYRNAPNTIPAILRGARGQQPYAGLFPRTNDVPPLPLGAPGRRTTKARDNVFRVKDEAARAPHAEKPPSVGEGTNDNADSA
jgi:hypothetical protein